MVPNGPGPRGCGCCSVANKGVMSDSGIYSGGGPLLVSSASTVP